MSGVKPSALAVLEMLLVSGRDRDGRCTYDPVAKAEHVQSCMQPGVSVACMALQCGINVNLLPRGITQSMGTDMKTGRLNMPTLRPAPTQAPTCTRCWRPERSPALKKGCLHWLTCG